MIDIERALKSVQAWLPLMPARKRLELADKVLAFATEVRKEAEQDLEAQQGQCVNLRGGVRPIR